MKQYFIKTALLKLPLFLTILLCLSFSNDNFKKTQLKYSKVKTAYTEKWEDLKTLLKSKSIDPGNFEIYMRAFKYDKKLEIWVRNISKDLKYTLLKTYDICALSGELGPKRKEGDGQIPEGFYEIDLLNPNSAYYLSMRVNYPNYSDRKLGDKRSPGGAIMVHGNCVTIGCIPITDECIKEVYVLAVETKNHGYKIPIDIYPCFFNEGNVAMLKKNYDANLISFWETLREGYNFFEKKKYTAVISTDKTGKYLIKN